MKTVAHSRALMNTFFNVLPGLPHVKFGNINCSSGSEGLGKLNSLDWCFLSLLLLLFCFHVLEIGKDYVKYPLRHCSYTSWTALLLPGLGREDCSGISLVPKLYFHTASMLCPWDSCCELPQSSMQMDRTVYSETKELISIACSGETYCRSPFSPLLF